VCDLSPEQTLQMIDSMLRIAATEQGVNEKLHDLGVQLQGFNYQSILVRAGLWTEKVDIVYN